MRLPRMSLLVKIWVWTSVVLTAVSGIAGWLLQRQALETTFRSVEEEVKASFQAYESLWRMRAESLRSVSAIISSMPHVRAAFGTRDHATIRDTTSEIWTRVSDDLQETSFFLVTDPEGNTIASLDVQTTQAPRLYWPVVRSVRSRFPDQVSGFSIRDGELFQIVLTPVYVDSTSGPALINVLLTGYSVNHLLAQRFKEATGGSDFVFLSDGKIFASTLNDRATGVLAARITAGESAVTLSDGVSQYVPLVRNLIDLEGNPVGKLAIFRSFDSAREQVAHLRRTLVLLWLAALAAGLGLMYLVARRIVQPVKELDRAAAEVARQNYEYRVQPSSQDELGRLASTFNTMCGSLQSARAELIRQERISTIGRMASSIVHDLRNPLAAIYGGAEMMVDTDLTRDQMSRVAGNIYRASRRIQELLQDLVNVSHGRGGEKEVCRLAEIVEAAIETSRAPAESRSVRLLANVAEEIEVNAARARLERVFLNLIDNAIEAMPSGGEVHIRAHTEGGYVLVEVEDTGPGLSEEIRSQLFQPFTTRGKKNGLGLGLALSRQTVLDHGGDIWAASEQGRGAKFCLRFPLAESNDTPPGGLHAATFKTPPIT
ncbi:MAG TPA: ATP-binding protein [Bryobacteraceae bacterium]|nr:ATP-binding protein [Bryobacteraceae bacterium]